MPARRRLPAPRLLLALLAAVLAAPGCLPGVPGPGDVGDWSPGPGDAPAREVRFESSDGAPLRGWLMCPPRETRGTILFLHGLKPTGSAHARSLRWLVEAGYEVFAVDYQVYRGSRPWPDVPGVHRDAQAALARLLSLPGVTADRYVVFGQSFGGAIAVHTVAAASPPERPAALVLESTFSGYRRIVRDLLRSRALTWPLAWPAGAFIGEGYSPDRWIVRTGSVPVVVIHGTRDALIPYGHGETLYGLAGDPKELWTVEGGGHIEALEDPAVRGKLLAFLDSVIPPGRKGACHP